MTVLEVESTIDEKSQNTGIWDRLLKTFKTDSHYGVSSFSKKKALLIVGGTSDQQKIIIDKLRSSSNKNSLFSSNKSKNNSAEIANEFSLGYTYMQYYLKLNEDRRQEEIIGGDDLMYNVLDIYTLCSTEGLYGEKEFDFEHYFNLLQIFKEKEFEDLLVLQLFSLDGYNEKNFDVQQIVNRIIPWCKLLNDAFSKQMKNDIVKKWFYESLLEYYPNPTSAILNNESNIQIEDQTKGECDFPIGCNYLLMVTGTEFLDTSMNPLLSQLEIDKLQQILRMIVLKVGGSFCYLPNFTKDEMIFPIIKLLNKLLINNSNGKFKSKTKIEPIINNFLNILIPRGWDTWGKIKTLNENIDLDFWNEEFEKLIQKTQETEIDEKKKNIVSTGNEDLINDKYQNFLLSQYKKQLEQDQKLAIEKSKGISRQNNNIENVKSILDNENVTETQSSLQNFRNQFLSGSNFDDDDEDDEFARLKTSGNESVTSTYSQPDILNEFLSDILRKKKGI
ncbi:hypothetical protein PACTADRAFT_48730 [Pachysolen tannophilus NRRL Y-2460]|uniref:Dynein light intermediate chain n=1 Tax=Pachysolen tannophilus NRRL Y-2460 TaxID=669874 RepID=A0A1E4TYW4_PACTA|nr:hypothetical protein PACTADRAFT_48730 [Pachysolen tannophilus NRRL Y-2460]